MPYHLAMAPPMVPMGRAIQANQPKWLFVLASPGENVYIFGVAPTGGLEPARSFHPEGISSRQIVQWTVWNRYPGASFACGVADRIIVPCETQLGLKS